MTIYSNTGKKIFIFGLLIQLLFLTAITRAQGRWTIVDSGLVFQHPPFASCHASTLTALKNGHILISCFAGSHEGANDVAIWNATALDHGRFTSPKKVAAGKIGDSGPMPLWNPVLYTQRDGTVLLYYKEGPNPREWAGYYIESGNNGISWKQPVALPPGILGPIKNKPVLTADGRLLCPSSVEMENGKWYATIEISQNGKTGWQSCPIDSSNSWGVIQPTILQYGRGAQKRFQALLRSNQNYILQSWSRDGEHWSTLQKTELRNPNSGIDGVSLKDGLQLLVYNPAPAGKNWWDGRSHLNVATSTDGIHWKNIIVLEAQSKGEYSYPSVIQSRDGLVHITYTYDRKNIKYVVLKQIR